ncbi:MAG: hypothetical protein O7H40_03205 [Gammaproteobacteria bacterium]|nr:hypothetical protein [Gammaproteobacteria bacterium]
MPPQGSKPQLDEEYECFKVEHDVMRKWADDKPALGERIDRGIGNTQFLIDESRAAIEKI